MIVDSVIERLNLWGDRFAHIAWPLFWQSSLLIAGMFVLDLFLRRKLRASVRHALWLVVLIKLLLPPSLALPSGIAWWLRPREVAPAKPQPASYVITYGSFQDPHSSRREEAPSSLLPVLPPVRLSARANALLASVAFSATLLIVMLVRWRHLRHQLRFSQPAPIWLQEMIHDTRRKARCRRCVRLMLTDASISPALCGLFRPVVILPTTLVQQLRPDQLQAVLLHELFHLRNGDVWINCFQSLMQIVFWWHPFLWLANARIRGIREEVVDDSVRLALGEQAETYAPTLLEVARLALARPLATLGLVGILESRNALKQRVDRLVNFPAPRRAGLSIVSGFAILAFASVALPMGQAPPKIVKSVHSSNSSTVLADYGKIAESPKMGWDIQPLTDTGWVQYDLASGIGTATNRAVVKQGGTTISSDYITFNQQTGEVVANGSIRIQSGATNPAVEIKSANENGWINYDAATSTATATNGATISYGDTTLSADSITLNRETGELSAEGSVKLKKGADIPLDGKFRSDVTRLFAQNQPSLPTRTIHTATGRRAIMNKLDAIRLNHVSFDNLPLSEVVKYLQDEARKRDPEGKCINFILNPNTDLDGAAGPPAIDPATGLQIPPQQIELVDINGVSIRILPALEDVSIHDVLDLIIKVANPRLRYSIEDYGISFRVAGNATPVPLFTRVIKVDPNVFAQGLESVVGFSVGNFQTGGQGGGGGQGNSSGVTVPRVQVAPNIGGQGAQGGQGGGAQGGAGGISGVTRPTTTLNTQQAMRQFFVNAGVDLTPPKSVFFNDRAGTILVHASLNDLDIIEQAVGTLSTTAGQPPTARVTNPPLKPVSPQTNVAKVPILGDLPVVSSQFQIGTAQVAAANSPQTMTNDTSSGTGEKLVTRIIKVDPNTFGESVRKVAGLLDNASPQETIEAFRKLVLNTGVELRAPANIFYSEGKGSLFVHATAAEMEAIEQFVTQLNIAPAQVNIKAKFVEVSEDDTKALSKAPDFFPVNADTNSSMLAILTDPQFRVVLHVLETRDGADLISEQSVTTVSGRQAQMQSADLQTILKLNPQALAPPGASNAFVTETLSSGPLLDVIPYVAEGGDKIQLTITAKVTEFLGYDPPPENSEAVPVYVDGQATTIKQPHPQTHARTMQAAVNLYDGQTVMLGRPKDEMISYDKEGKALTAPSTSKKNLLVFVTATVIDAAGNPVHRADSSSSPQSH